VVGAVVVVVGAEPEPDTDPKKSPTLFPFKALATALSNAADTVTPEALRTALNDY
jgi:hypothetical protein